MVFFVEKNLIKNKSFYNNFILRRSIHGYVSERLKVGPFKGSDLRDLRCGLVLGIFIGFRLEILDRFRRLRKTDMYKRRTSETRENIFLMGTLMSWASSQRDKETGLSLMYMDKWLNKCHFFFRASAYNVFGFAQWDLRSFFRPYSFYKGRKNYSNSFLIDSIKNSSNKWQTGG